MRNGPFSLPNQSWLVGVVQVQRAEKLDSMLLVPRPGHCCSPICFPQSFMSWIQQDWRYKKPCVGNKASHEVESFEVAISFLTQQSEKCLPCAVKYITCSHHLTVHSWFSTHVFSNFSLLYLHMINQESMHSLSVQSRVL